MLDNLKKLTRQYATDVINKNYECNCNYCQEMRAKIIEKLKELDKI